MARGSVGAVRLAAAHPRKSRLLVVVLNGRAAKSTASLPKKRPKICGVKSAEWRVTASPSSSYLL